MYQLERFEDNFTRALRRYPLLAVAGLIASVALLMTAGKPILFYVLNAFQRMMYKSTFMGAEGSALAQETWRELVAECNSIREMGWMGELLMSMPSIFRMLIVCVAGSVVILAGYFLVNTWEASIDYHVWEFVIYGFCLAVEGVLIIVKALLFAAAVGVVRTCYGVRRVYRKARKEYRRWKRKNAGLFEAR